MTAAKQKQKTSIYRCNVCKLRFARLEDMAFGEDGLMCPYCYREEMDHKSTLSTIAIAIWVMKLELDRRERR